MAIARNYDFKPMLSHQILANHNLEEAFSELFQDSDRSGFQNLGSGNAVHFQTVTADQFINAQGGNDTISLEGNTNDTVFGGSGDDVIDGGAGNDTLNGGSGKDTIFGGAGADKITGGSGDDFLYGDNDAVAFSLHGIDTINGGSGNDIIYGGGKADILTGGSGNDTFVYFVGLGPENESRVGAGADHITDFQAGDKIDVSFMDANSSAAGNNAFSFSSTASTAAGSFWIDNRADGQHVFFNIDGGAADMEIIVENSGHQLVESDFHL
jgi:Ca2+-binding RTX toxin-like protein